MAIINNITESKVKNYADKTLAASGLAFMVGFATVIGGSYVGPEPLATVGAWVTWASAIPLVTSGMIRFHLRNR